MPGKEENHFRYWEGCVGNASAFLPVDDAKGKEIHRLPAVAATPSGPCGLPFSADARVNGVFSRLVPELVKGKQRRSFLDRGLVSVKQVVHSRPSRGAGQGKDRRR